MRADARARFDVGVVDSCSAPAEMRRGSEEQVRGWIGAGATGDGIGTGAAVDGIGEPPESEPEDRPRAFRKVLLFDAYGVS